MNKIYYLIIVCICLCAACKKNDAPDVRPVDATVTLGYQVAGAEAVNFPLGDITIKLEIPMKVTT